jgi:hypothetical protein
MSRLDRGATAPVSVPLAPPRQAVLRWLNPNGILGLAVAALLGLGFALWLYKYPMLRGTAPFWWRDNSDITQYVAGFNAFVHEPWHWPLLRIASLNAPDGTLATFLDTIPLYAMFLKLVHPGAGYWNPYGLWIALCFTLQGASAWWICREAKVRNWAALVALALLLAAFPTLTRRIPHTGLMSQWLLLFGLAVYLRSGRLGRLATGPWVALLTCAFYIHIYLFAMLLRPAVRHHVDHHAAAAAGCRQWRMGLRLLFDEPAGAAERRHAAASAPPGSPGRPGRRP